MSAPVPPLYRNRDFVLLWAGSAVSILGSNVSNVAYPLLVLALTGSATDAGLTGFVSLLPQLLFQLPAGALVDRCDRKRMMIYCDLLCALVLGTLVVALLFGRLTLPHILVVGFLEGTFAVCYRLAAAAAVPNVVDASQLPLALARNEARRRGAAMLGKPLGGILFGFGRAVPFVFDIVSYAVSVLTLGLIRKDFQVQRDTASKRPRAAEFTEGAVWLWRQPFLRATTLLIAGSNLLFQALFLVVIVIADNHGASPATVGFMLGIIAVGGVLGSLVAPAAARRLSLKTVVIGANWVWLLLVPLLVVVDHPLLLGAVFGAMAFVGPLWNVGISAYQLAITPDHLQGRVLAAAGMIAFGAVPLGSLIGGYLLGWVGATSTVWLLTLWMGALALTTVISPAVRSAPDLAELEAPAPAK
ncbi:MFS transporter [Amycolatopsis umgeniensis]|uniref:MFS family permease n=1 Tax=Amycolatopsis umgeniensis TaxID=336628 RepID=A0A841B981_9PSEU|nr:MFS transporter [Amycolatopsis umgeniensis]MBB5857459.1 MFS family permease [Amycolatopsis umgeniensis]